VDYKLDIEKDYISESEDSYISGESSDEQSSIDYGPEEEEEEDQEAYKQFSIEDDEQEVEEEKEDIDEMARKNKWKEKQKQMTWVKIQEAYSVINEIIEDDGGFEEEDASYFVKK
ncbi:MAG: hypothetical protein EZS28_030502, partial [Streblomastix strix]